MGGDLSGAGTERPGIVHRLDKDTSGLLLVARDDAAHAALATALKDRSIGRTYLALVRGAVAEDKGTVDAPIGRHPVNRRRMAVAPGGRSAVTHYEVLGRSESFPVSLLEVTLETGRTHQIRVHLAHLRHPVVGDRTYGGGAELADRLGLSRPFLHACRLRFPHPEDGRQVTVEDPLPRDLARVLKAAELDL
jgi:23S rRNA pseudouridine1911/1915/1917 synthase